MEIHRIGFTELTGIDSARPGPYRSNIIFVHGLRGHPKHTWEGSRDEGSEEGAAATLSRRNTTLSTSTADYRTNEDRCTKVFWPDEYLTRDIPDARIWTYGYNADVIGGLFQPNNQNSVSQHGRDLAVRLDRDIGNTDPIFFVVHSLGGIIVKDAIRRSQERPWPTRLIIFLGTPHRGSGYAGWGEIASNLARLIQQDSNKKIVETLKVNSEVLDNIHDDFKNIVHESGIKIHSFQEGQGILGMKGLHNKVVDDFSSKLDLPRQLETVESMDANHMQMARCSKRADPRYHAILGVLKQSMRNATLDRDETRSQEKVLAASFGAQRTSTVSELGRARSDQQHVSPTYHYRTFRIRGVPFGWDARFLQAFLTEQESSAGPMVRHLANEVHGRSQVATVSFQSIPAPLQTVHSWRIPLPASFENQPARSQYIALDDSFLGMTTLYTPPQEDHKVHIVVISGLGGHAFGSFKERGGEYMWLRDSLPFDLTSDGDGRPLARVMIYGYESSVPRSKNIQNVEDLSTSFHHGLLALTGIQIIRPIIFIAHSLGGLIVKQKKTIISLAKSKSEDDRRLARAVYGIIFFGVPHDGMDISSLIPMVGDGPNRFLIESIGRVNSQILSIQQREFHKALGGKGDSKIFCFFETVESPTAIQKENGDWEMSGPTAILVTKTSATHCRSWEDGPEYICAINRTHSDMVKFEPEDHEYENVLQRLKNLTRHTLMLRNQNHGLDAQCNSHLNRASTPLPDTPDDISGMSTAPTQASPSMTDSNDLQEDDTIAQETALTDMEEALVESAIARIRRAQEKGKTGVKLKHDELEALEKRRRYILQTTRAGNDSDESSVTSGSRSEKNGRSDTEEALVQSALARIRRAQDRRETEVRLNYDELLALEKRRKQSLQATKIGNDSGENNMGSDKIPKKRERSDEVIDPIAQRHLRQTRSFGSIESQAGMPVAGPTGSLTRDGFNNNTSSGHDNGSPTGPQFLAKTTAEPLRGEPHVSDSSDSSDDEGGDGFQVFVEERVPAGNRRGRKKSPLQKFFRV